MAIYFNYCTGALLGWLLLAASSTAQAETPRLFFEAKLEPAEPYIQAQVLYTVHLYHTDRYLLGYFVPPEIVDVVSIPLDETESVEVQRDGSRYWMKEQRYLLFPQRSGAFVIPGMVFSGREAYGRGRDVVLRVRARPVTAPTGGWIPAEEMRISEVWPERTQVISVGDIIDRVVTIEAKGVTAAQLLPLELPESSGLKVRRRRVELNDRIEGESVTARRIEYQTVIFTAAGSHRLPVTFLSWWDTSNDQPQRLTLPGRVVEVTEAETGRLLPDLATTLQGATSDSTSREQPGSDQHIVLPGALWSGSLMALVVTLLLWFTTPSAAAVISYRLHCYATRHEIRRACLRNDVREALYALHRWQQLCGDSVWPTLATAVTRLEAVVYGPPGGDWAGGEFWKRVAPLLHQRSSGRIKCDAGVLPHLKPE